MGLAPWPEEMAPAFRNPQSEVGNPQSAIRNPDSVEVVAPAAGDRFHASDEPCEKGCALCGLPAGRTRIRWRSGSEEFHFCCPGCRGVFQLLFSSADGVPANFRETELYRACVDSGLIPGDAADLEGREALVASGGQAALLSSKGEPHVLSLSLGVDGMWCPACAWLIEEVLGRTRGVLSAKVSFLTDLAEVTYSPAVLGPEEIARKISRLGYAAAPLEEAGKASPERKDLLLRLGVSAVLTTKVMMISMALYLGFFEDLTAKGILYLSLPLWGLATPVLLYGGAPILRKGWASLLHGAPSMETLISLGALASYGYSVAQMAQGSLHLYFDTACMLVTLVLLGRYIEVRTREKITRGLTDLERLAHSKVRLWILEKEKWVSSERVLPGDAFLVSAGERIPLDGRIVQGRASVNESIMTGEPRPVSKGPGDTVLGGTLLLEGEIRGLATHVGRDSAVGQILGWVHEVLAHKTPAEQLADRITNWFVPAALGLAAITALGLGATGLMWEDALLRAVTVLVISCPCALGIATPLVKVAAMETARDHGILLCGPEALERAWRLDAMVLDKTGTVTQGRFALNDVLVQGTTREEALGLVGALEAGSSHPLAREIVEAARASLPELPSAVSFEEVEGLGVRGLVQGKHLVVGNRGLMHREGMELPPWLEEEARAREFTGSTAVFFGWDGQVRGLLAFGDSIKPGAHELIQGLRSRGMMIWLVSGDGPETTEAVARELGMEHSRGGARPQDKLAAVRSLQEGGHRVGMVGDGLNDAAALAQADLGCALGVNTLMAHETSDIAILSEDPTKVLDALELSGRARRAMRQNLFFAFAYNAIAIPTAMGGLLNPLVAVFAMFASSLTVIANALRIRRPSRG